VTSPQTNFLKSHNVIGSFLTQPKGVRDPALHTTRRLSMTKRPKQKITLKIVIVILLLIILMTTIIIIVMTNLLSK